MHRISSLRAQTRVAPTTSYPRTVLSLLIRAGAAAALVFQLTVAGAWAAEIRLDLTHRDVEPGETEHPGGKGVGPAITGGGYSGMKPLLPVRLSIRDISPRSVTPLDQITVEVVLRNVGKEAIMLPFRSGNHWRTGVHGQRDISLGLELTVPGGKGVPIFLGSAYGASDIPGSLVTLAPNDTLALRASASLRETRVWSGALAGPLDVKAAVYVNEARWDDTRFEIIATSRLDMAASPTPLTWSEAK